MSRQSLFGARRGFGRRRGGPPPGLILVALLGIAAMRWRRYAGHHRFGPGPAGWRGREAPRDVPPMFEPMLEAWHRRAHGQQAAAPSEPSAPFEPASGPSEPA